jgi:hypothetical protein
MKHISDFIEMVLMSFWLCMVIVCCLAYNDARKEPDWFKWLLILMAIAAGMMFCYRLKKYLKQ